MIYLPFYVLCGLLFIAEIQAQGSDGDRCKYASEATDCKSPTTGLVCKDGGCRCRFQDHQNFEYVHGGGKSCLSRVHGPCLIKDVNISMPCIKNAICVEDSQHPNYHTCQCSEGFVEAGDRRCQIRYGGKCKKGDASICDSFAELVCLAGKCQCNDQLQVYDEKLGKCVGIIGAVCSFVEPSHCSGGTFCKELRGSDSLKGICACQNGLKWNGKECAK